MNSSKIKTDFFNMQDKNPAVTVFVIVSLAVIVLWIADMVIKNLQISFAGLVEIHRINPAVWLIDLLPFILSYNTFKNKNRKEQEQENH
jgi:hypothetical protein